MLRSFILALHNNFSGDVCDPYSRVSDIDVLAPFSRCAISVDPKVIGIDVHIDIFVYFRIDEYSSKGCMPSFIGVKGRYPDQSMDT